MRNIKKKIRKGFTGFLAFCMILSSFNMTAWAQESDGEALDNTGVVFYYDAETLREAAVTAIEDGIANGTESNAEEMYWLADGNAKLEVRYQELLNQDYVYEVFADYKDNGDMIPDGAGVRVFVQTDGKDYGVEGYQLKGSEKLIFLFMNGSGSDLVFRADVDGSMTPEVAVISQDRILDETELEEEEIEVKDETATGSDAVKETPALPDGGTVAPSGDDKDETTAEDLTDGKQETPEQNAEETVGEGEEIQNTEEKKPEVKKTDPLKEAEIKEDPVEDKAAVEDKADAKDEAEAEVEDKADTGVKKETVTGSLVSMSVHEVPMVASSLEGSDVIQELDENLTEDSSDKVINQKQGDSFEDDQIIEDEEITDEDGQSSDSYVKTGTMEGTILGTVVSDEGYRARAFVTTMKSLVGKGRGDQQKAGDYTLTVSHGLLVDNIYYYENQNLQLDEEDFAQDGSYDYSEAVYKDKVGIMAAETDQEMIINKASFKESSDSGYTREAVINYTLVDGYKVTAEAKPETEAGEAKPETEAAAKPEMAHMMKMGRSTFVKKEGFPAVSQAADQTIKIEDQTAYIITADPGATAESGQKIIVAAGTAPVIGLYGGSTSNGSSVVVKSDVKNLTLNLGAGEEDKTLTLDAGSKTVAGLKVEAGAQVKLMLVGDTVIVGGKEHAGIELNDRDHKAESKDQMAKVTIAGAAALSAQGGDLGAGIGGGSNAPNGILIIESGVITAKGGEEGAGIGGGGNSGASGNNDASGTNGSYKNYDRSGGVITINGGEITATGGKSAAGIGGGDHGDGGETEINDSAVVKAVGGNGGAGIGSGLGSHQQDNDGAKGPGYYHGGKITINGGEVTARGMWNAAGIGGGYCADSGEIVINGGSIKAYGDVGNSGSDYQGGAGIGGGYEGHGDVTINGGEIEAYTEKETSLTKSSATGIGSGATPNTNQGRKLKARGKEATLDKTTVTINDGKVTATGGQAGGAGIGSGFGADKCIVNISGGTITATGGESSREKQGTAKEKIGGAGIGGGCYSSSLHATYLCETDLDIDITGGTILATGGWGASGIGSGGGNKRADSITIGDDAEVTALADGTKFAVDSYDRNSNSDLAFLARAGARILQGTFMDINAEADNYEGLSVSIYQDMQQDSGEQQIVSSTVPEGEVVQLPVGYRSFAVSARIQTPYLVKAEKVGVEAQYFAYDIRGMSENKPADNDSQTYHYATGLEDASDNYWLYLLESRPEIVEKEPDPTPTPTPDPAPAPAPSPNLGAGSSDSGGNDVTSAGSRNTGSRTADTVNIADQGVPLASLPQEPNSELTIISDGDIPLAPLPKTGNQASASGWIMVISGLLLAVYTMTSKKEKEN